MYITEDQILETLDSDIEILRNNKIENIFNDSSIGDLIHKGHTRAMQTDHMKNNGLSVQRVMNKDGNKTIEYHLFSSNHSPGEDTGNIDKKSVLHSMNIISQDAPYHLEKGRPILISSTKDTHHIAYQRLAKHLLKKNNMEHKKITDIGSAGEGNDKIYRTLIESLVNQKKINFHEFIRDLINGNDAKSDYFKGDE